jgi:hypothetical protein
MAGFYVGLTLGWLTLGWLTLGWITKKIIITTRINP